MVTVFVGGLPEILMTCCDCILAERARCILFELLAARIVRPLSSAPRLWQREEADASLAFGWDDVEWIVHNEDINGVVRAPHHSHCERATTTNTQGECHSSVQVNTITQMQ